MRAFLLATISGLMVCGTAKAGESNYDLRCDREYVPTSRAKAKRTASPFVARIMYTGRTRLRPNAPGQQGEQRMEDLIITIRDKQMLGGLVQGSTYDASTTYDDAYERGGEGATTWGYAKDLEAFTLTFKRKTYVCNIR